ncbi:hypothetical protein DPMN_150326 [Dreissena polymorpha]|uniref:Uncharacterized protein n=2 Tax=Dreissena polymorpha TaxID=45954 RepID=A0A9D4FHT0_DREPO|nr:hypothetical protein DPMN_150326 [Dreissena polymorpha]
MDIEGDEWNSIPQMIATRSLDDIQQIAMETHFYAPGIGSENVPGRRQLPVLRELYDAGFRIFMRDRNLVSARRIDEKVNKKYVTALNEISLIKVH